MQLLELTYRAQFQGSGCSQFAMLPHSPPSPPCFCRPLPSLPAIPNPSSPLQLYAPTTLAPPRDFCTLRYTTMLNDGVVVSLREATGLFTLECNEQRNCSHCQMRVASRSFVHLCDQNRYLCSITVHVASGILFSSSCWVAHARSFGRAFLLGAQK